MNQQLSVSKRDGRKEPLDLDKIHRVIEWAAEGLNNVSVSQVELKSHIQFYDGIRTKDIHETIIKAAAAPPSDARRDRTNSIKGASVEIVLPSELIVA